MQENVNLKVSGSIEVIRKYEKRKRIGIDIKLTTSIYHSRHKTANPSLVYQRICIKHICIT